MILKMLSSKSKISKGDLCPFPHGNFTFSDLPVVRRDGQTDHVDVSWKHQVMIILKVFLTNKTIKDVGMSPLIILWGSNHQIPY